MSRNRIIYNVLALYAGKNNAVSGSHSNPGDIKQLTRVQTFDEDFARTLTNVDQYGNLAAIDRIEIEAPTVKSSFSYYLTDGSNENYIGLNVATGNQPLVSCVSGYLTKETDQKNYFLLISDEGNDASNYANSRTGVIGVGNAFLTSYDVEAAVGQIPTASLQLEALNVRVYSEVDGTNDIPAINPALGTAIAGVPFVLPVAKSNDSAGQVSALQPGDLTLDIAGLIGVNQPDLKIQSFNMSVPLARQPISRLGNKFAFTREIQFPVTTTFSIEAELGDLQDGNLADVLCETGKHNINIGFRKPNCSGNGALALVYQFRGAKLLTQKITTSIGDNAKFSAEFEAQIGGPQDLLNGVFISGSYPVA
jgi:hypothetical protein